MSGEPIAERGKGPLVSVVIPCYKQARFLPDALESVVGQTYPVIEIIVVDDGSPDNVPEVLTPYPTIDLVRQENRGLAFARNTGFRQSNGQYLLFLDADDRLASNAVEKHLSCFARSPEAGFVVGDIDHITFDGSHAGSPRWPLLEGNCYEELLRANHIANTVAVMFRRTVIEELHGFDRECSPAEDYDLLLRAARVWPSAHHRTVVAQYRRHPASLSRDGVTMLRAMDHVMQQQRRITAGDPKLENARRQGVRYWREHFGRTAIKQIFAQVSRLQVWAAFRSTIALLWFVRGSLPILPIRYAVQVARRGSRNRQRERVERSAEG